MSKWYGNIINRIAENGPSAPIEVGTDITEYMWSDRDCYYVTEVISPKAVKVRRYIVVADRDKEGGMGHQDWLYFKTNAEANEYLKKYNPELARSDYEYPEETWVYRYNKWWTKHQSAEGPYYSKHESVRFGVRDYYYDWSF